MSELEVDEGLDFGAFDLDYPDDGSSAEQTSEMASFLRFYDEAVRRVEAGEEMDDVFIRINRAAATADSVGPILGAALLDLLDVLKGEVVSELSAVVMVVGFLAAFLTGCAACKWMIAIVKRQKLVYFAIYCAVVGTASIVFSLIG